jgi:anti-sigma regulatory factor (Ser/Thr protein kinase)
METVMSARSELVGGRSLLMAVEDHSQVGGARRAAIALGQSYGLSKDSIGRVAIVVTEAATNLIRHAGGGSIILRGLFNRAASGLEVLSIDKGPGIPDVHRAMRDGFSTSGTGGQGLGGMQRLSNVFSVYSQRDGGTVMVSRIYDDGDHAVHAPPAPSVEDRFGAVCVPIRKESECGDAWRLGTGAAAALVLIDGLGHGPEAAEAARVGMERFEENSVTSPVESLLEIHDALRPTRGAAMSMSVIDDAAGRIEFVGIGNVDARIVTADESIHLPPQNGIVGHTIPTPRITTAPWPAGACLVMHTDGLSARWRLDAYPGLRLAHPALIAGVLFRDFGRERDDATVVVLRRPPGVS